MAKNYFVILAVAAIAGLVFSGGIYLWQEKGKDKAVQIKNDETQVDKSQPDLTPPSAASPTTSKPLSKNTICDNFQCLISAASECKPIATSISYSGMPMPLTLGFSISGTVKAEIKKASDVNNCILISSTPITSVSISDKERKSLLDQGITNAEITAQSEKWNNDSKSAAILETTCQGNKDAVADYLTDYESNLRTGTVRVDASDLDFETGAYTHTTPSGKKLRCKSVEVNR